jgi:acyl-CoA reductase-like NAD-dependent aldehyde dehydrogenase
VGEAVGARARQLVWKIGERLMEKADEIARLETLHNGKPIFESRHIEVPGRRECFQYFAGWADKIHGETIPVKGNYLTYTLREPIGVVAAIVPWNFPLLLTAWKVAPALACGNTVIIKPASQTPLTALALAEIAHEVGLPPACSTSSPARDRRSARCSSSIPASTRSRSPATPPPARGS